MGIALGLAFFILCLEMYEQWIVPVYPSGGSKLKDKSRVAEENPELIGHLRAPKLLKLSPSVGDLNSDKISR